MQNDGKNLLTHSRLSTYRKCPKKHWIAYELGIRPDRIGAPLRIGGAFHKGADLLAKGIDRDDSIMQAIAGYDEVPAWAGSADDERDWLYERETVLRLLHAYSLYWAEQGMEVVAAEQRFDIPIVNPATGAPATAHRLAGMIDRIVRLMDGRLAVLETKTTGDSIAADSEYWSRLAIDAQISLYLHAARELGHDCVTVLYDVVRKPSIGPTDIPELDADGLKQVIDQNGERVRLTVKAKAKCVCLGSGLTGTWVNGQAIACPCTLGAWRQSGDAEKRYVVLCRPMTPKEWGDKLSADIAERPEFYFARKEIARLDTDLDTFRKELWWAHQDILARRREGHWPRNPEACMNPFRCEHRTHCWLNMDVEHEVPEGFIKLDWVHPELAEVQ